MVMGYLVKPFNHVLIGHADGRSVVLISFMVGQHLSM